MSFKDQLKTGESWNRGVLMPKFNGLQSALHKVGHSLLLQLQWLIRRRVEPGNLEPGPVQCMSMPRSGHHWMVDNLAAYRSDFRYCEWYTEAGCCRTVPCRNQGFHLVKNHDVDGRAIKTDRRKYIVQIREPVPSIVSHFEMAVADKHIEDSAAQWRAFAIAQARYRNRFVAKWLVKRPQHTMVLHYEDARAEPAVALRDLCRFVFDCEPDEDRIASIAGNVAGGRKVEEFRYYDHTFFASLHRRSAPAERLTDSFRRF